MVKIGDLIVDLKTNLAQFQQDMGRAAKTVEQTAERINRITTGIQASIAGIGGALLFGKIIEGAAGAELAFKKVESVIRSTGGAAGLTANQVKGLADQMEKLTAIDGDLIAEAQSVMLTFTNIGKDVFPRATKAMLDMSTIMGGDLKGAAVQLGKALNDPVEGISALQRVGVTFTASQKALIKSLVESGQLMKAQTVILGEFERQMGGAAEAARNSLSGALKELKLAFEDVLENIGSSRAQGLRGAVEALSVGLRALAQNGETVTKVIEGFAAAAGTVVALKLGKEMQGIVQAIGTLAKAGGGVAAALAVAVGALVLFRDEQIKIGDTTTTVGQVITDTLSTVTNVTKPFINAQIGFLVTVGEALQDFWKLVEQVGTGIGNVISAAAPLLQKFFGISAQGIDDLLAQARNALKSFGVALQNDQGVIGKFARNMSRDWVGGFVQPAMDWTSELNQKLQGLGKFSGGGAGKAGGGLAANMEEEWQKTIAAAQEHSQELEDLLRDAVGVAQAKQFKQWAGKDPDGGVWADQMREQKERAKLHEQQVKSSKELVDSLEKQVDLLRMRNAKNVEGILQAEVEKELLHYKNLSYADQAKLYDDLLKLKREEKELEAIGEMASKVEQLKQQAEAIERKVAGQGELNEQLKLQREIEQNLYLSADKKQELIDQIAAYSERIRQANQALEEHKRVIDKILQSNDSFALKIKKLGEALKTGAINTEEYKDALQKVQDAQDKAKSSFQSFAEKVTSGFEDAIMKGKKLSDVFKDLGKELLAMVAKKFLFEPIQQGITGLLSKVFPTGQFGLQPGGGGFQFGGFNLGGLFNLFKGGGKVPGVPAVPGINPPPGTTPAGTPAFNPAGGGLGTPGTSSFQNMGAFGPLIHTGDGGPAWKVYMVNCPCGPSPLMANNTGNPLLPALNNPPAFPPGGGFIPPGVYSSSTSTSNSKKTTTTQESSWTPEKLSWLLNQGQAGGILGGLLGGGMLGAGAGMVGGSMAAASQSMIPWYLTEAGRSQGTYGYGTIGGYSAQGKAAASMAMVADRDRHLQQLQYNSGDVHPDLKAGWVQQAQASWNNAILTNSYSNQSGYYRPPPGLQGPNYSSGWGSASNALAIMSMGHSAGSALAASAPSFTPGLTGGINRAQMYAPVGSGGGQAGGAVGPYFQRDANPAVARLVGYANGGRPRVNIPSMVGERGPELFIPDTTGTVVPFEKIRKSSEAGGGGKPNISLVNNTGVQMAEPEVTMAANGDPQIILNKMVARGQSSHQARRALKRNTNVVERPTRRS